MRQLLLLCALWGGVASAQSFGPFGNRRHPVTGDVRTPPIVAAAARVPGALTLSDGRLQLAPLPPSTFLYLSYELYRNFLSPVDGPTCNHRPTCSRYALLAVQRHPVAGLWLAVDRLWRGMESSALRRLPLVHGPESFYLLDPLEESDFWLRSH